MKPIWIVDDDPSIRFVLEKALARENLDTRSFSNPREVLNALADLPEGDPAHQGPRVLVSDIRMPGGSGLQLLEEVHAKQPDLPVIIMTAYSDLDSASLPCKSLHSPPRVRARARARDPRYALRRQNSLFQ